MGYCARKDHGGDPPDWGRLWEEQGVMADRIQDGVMDPHTTMELPQLEQLFRDMKRLMYEKQKILMTINPPTEDA